MTKKELGTSLEDSEYFTVHFMKIRGNHLDFITQTEEYKTNCLYFTDLIAQSTPQITSDLKGEHPQLKSPSFILPSIALTFDPVQMLEDELESEGVDYL